MKERRAGDIKTVECDDCGKVSEISKWIPIRLSWCSHCRSLKIRLYPPRKRRRFSKLS